MTIRTIVAAAALVAFTTPAFAQETTIVAEPSTLQGILSGGGFAAGTTYIMVAGVIAAIVVVENGKTTIDTDV